MRTIRKHSEEDRNKYLRLWQESGLTQQAFCQEHDLVLRTFNTSKSSKAPASIQIGVGQYSGISGGSHRICRQTSKANFKNAKHFEIGSSTHP
jgi:hypothetical protein